MSLKSTIRQLAAHSQPTSKAVLGIPLLVLAASLLLTFILWQFAWRQSEERLHAEFELHVDQADNDLHRGLQSSLNILQAAQGLFAASAHVTREEFAQYAVKLANAMSWQGMQGIGYAVALSPAQLPKLEQEIRGQGYPDFKVFPDSGQQLRTAIIYLEPFSGRNLRAFGYDMYSDPVRRAAMEQAMELDQPVMSGKVTLIQENSRDTQNGFLIYLPVYTPNASHATSAEHRAHLLGWVYAPFRIRDFFTAALGQDLQYVDIEIYDGAVMQPQALLFRSSHAALPAGGPEKTVTMEFAQRTWLVRYMPKPVAAALWRQQATMIGMGGILIALFLATISYLLLNSRRHALELAEEMAQAAQERENRFRLLFEKIADPMLLYDPQRNVFVEWNQATLDMLGFPEGETFSRFHPVEISPELQPDGRRSDEKAVEMTATALRNGSHRFEWAVRSPYRELLLEVLLTAIVIEGQQMLIVTWRDLTQQKQAELQLARTQARWRFALEGSGQGLWELDLLSNRIQLSEHCKRMLGFSEEEVGDSMDDWLARIHPEDIPCLLEARRQVIDGDLPYFENQHRKRTKSGEWKWILVRGMVAERDDAGKPVALLGTYSDISQLKANEADLERLALVATKTTSAVIITDPEQRIEWVNPAFTALTGYALDEVIGQSPKMFQGENTDAHTLQQIRNHLQKPESCTLQLLNYHKNGDPYWVEIKIDPVFDQNGVLAHFIAVQTDITERVYARQALEKAERRWRFALEGAGAGVWDWNLEDDTVDFSDEWKHMLGYAPDDIEPELKEWKSRVHPEDLPQTLRDLEGYFSGKLPVYQNEHRMQCKDGSWKWILDRGMVVTRGDDGKPLRMIGTHTDIDARKRSEQEIRELNETLERKVLERTLQLELARDEADQASQAKSEFLSNMSHEIRTPLNAIVGMTHLALKSGPNAKQRGYLEKIDASSGHLLRIITDILDFSKIEAGMMVLDPQDFSLRQLIEDLRSMFSARLRDKGLDFTVQLDPAIPDVLRGDSLRLSQVLINLIGNAIKFTEQGAISVSAELLPGADAAHRVRFAVRDTGFGMQPHEVSRLFEPFQQADGSITRRYGGTGLGLAISKRIVALMEGEIGVDSMPGEGSTFWFTASLAQPESVQLPSATRAAAATEQDVSAIHGKRILLAEDNRFNQEIAQELLEQQGARVTIAENGMLALQKLDASEYDCVLMDMQMPVMDGLEATRQIRGNPRWAALPVIAMTANAFGKDRRLCLEAGMNDFLAKPVQPDTLYRVLAKHLAPGRSAAQGRVTTQATIAIERDAHIDLDVLAQLIGGNPAKLNKFVRMFIESARQVLDEMRLALEGNAVAAVGKLAHRIKSSARAVGASLFAEQSEHLEQHQHGENRAEIALRVEELAAELRLIEDRLAARLDDNTALLEQIDAALQVLVVDDEEFQRELLNNVLHDLGVRNIELVEDGEQALARMNAQAGAPDVIVCDLNMQPMAGTEFLRHLSMRKFQGGIVLLSGLDQDLLKAAERLAHAHGLHVLGTMQKPVSRGALLSMLANFAPVRRSA